jgi:hypothetical protein
MPVRIVSTLGAHGGLSTSMPATPKRRKPFWTRTGSEEQQEGKARQGGAVHGAISSRKHNRL